MAHFTELVWDEDFEVEQLLFVTARTEIGKGLARDKSTKEIIKKDYGFGKQFSFDVRGFDDLQDEKRGGLTKLMRLLESAGKSGMTALVHGLPAPNVDWQNAVRNRETIRERPLCLLAIDVDGIQCTTPEGANTIDPAKCAAFVRARLPTEFHDAACVWHASPGHNVDKGYARLRLFFRLATKLHPNMVPGWLDRGTVPYDRSIYHASQLIYLSVGVAEGMTDPFLGRRWGILDGARSKVLIPANLPVPQRKDSEKRGKPVPKDFEPDKPHMILEAIKRTEPRCPGEARWHGRNNNIRESALDFWDCGISEELTDDILNVYLANDGFDLLEEHLEAVDFTYQDIQDIIEATERLASAAEALDIWAPTSDGRKLTLDAEDVRKQVGDAYHGGQNAFGCDYISLENKQANEAHTASQYANDDEQEARRELAQERERALISEDGTPLEFPKVKVVYSRLISQAIREHKPLAYWIKDVLPRHGVGSIYGIPGSKKTFFAIDVAGHLAMGLDWRGYKTDRTGVVYWHGEGEEGLSGRMKAWAISKGLQDFPGTLVNTPLLNFYEQNTKKVLVIMKQLKQECEYLNQRKVGVFFIDTKSKATIGMSGNDDADAALVMRNAEIVARCLDIVIIFIDHTGKDESKGVRGSNVFEGNQDFLIHVGANGVVTFKRVRDGVTPPHFKLDVINVDIGPDNYGGRQTTLAVKGLPKASDYAVTDDDEPDDETPKDLGSSPAAAVPPSKKDEAEAEKVRAIEARKQARLAAEQHARDVAEANSAAAKERCILAAVETYRARGSCSRREITQTAQALWIASPLVGPAVLNERYIKHVIVELNKAHKLRLADNPHNQTPLYYRPEWTALDGIES